MRAVRIDEPGELRVVELPEPMTHEVALECARDAIDLVSGRSLEVSKVLLCP
jgi:hypothetical protein